MHMGDLIRFWIDCITRGATFGSGVFGIVEIICAFLWICYRKKGDEEGAKSRREEGVKAFGKWCFLIVFTISTIVVAPYLKYQEKQMKADENKTIADRLSLTNTFLSGQLEGQKTTISTLQNEIKETRQDAQTAQLNFKTDLNEANRQRDVALQRLDYFESNPEKLSEIYSNIFANTPTNFQQVDLMFAQYNTVLSNSLTEIETTTKQLQYSVGQSQYPAAQLSDLDQKTSDLEKLPDGRTKFGGVVTGSPTVITEAIAAGFKSAASNDIHGAFSNFQRAIMAFESTKPTGVIMDTSSNLTSFGKSVLYTGAGEAALLVGSNSLAIERQKKGIDYAYQAVKENPNFRAKWMLVLTLSDLGGSFRMLNDFTNSFEYFSEAITNCESINSPTNLMLFETNILKIYGTAVFVAFQIGKTNDAAAFSSEAAEIIRKINNPVNTN
jgi:hypothetical protein